MATIWRHEFAGKRYEVRRAGGSLRLYTNGAFHSQHNPRHLFTGAVWDLLSLPALFAPNLPRKILLMGLGGGTAVHQLRSLLSGCNITALELDPVHISVATRLFNVDADNVSLVQADAVDWLKRHRRRWDLVIDDIFTDAPADPERPVPVDAAWLGRLAARTGRHGVIVQNHLSPRLARDLACEHARLLTEQFAAGLLFMMPNYENGILALYRDRISLGHARRMALDRIAAIDAGAARKLRFSVRQLF